jgi:CheY-like chemotaxis protein
MEENMFNDEEHQDVVIKEEKSKTTKNDIKRTEKKERQPLFKKPQNMGLFIILCLLILQVLMSGYQTIRDIRQDVQRAQLIASVTKYTANADQLTSQMLTDYKKDVYANEKVNSTEKQQVMGTEYNFMAMMLLAKQNNRLLELLSQLR